MNKVELTCIRSNVITKNISGVAIYNTIPTSIGNVAEDIRNLIHFNQGFQKITFNLLILNFCDNILSGSFLFLIESFVDLVTLDLRGNMFVGVIHGSFAFNQDLSLIDNDLSDNILQRLYDLHLDFFLFNSCTVDECNCRVLGIHPVFLDRIHWQDVSSTSQASLICDLDVAIKYSKLAAMTGWHYLNSVLTLNACTRKVNNNKVFEIDLGHGNIAIPQCSFADLTTCDYFYVYCSIGDTILESIGKLTNQYDLEIYRTQMFELIPSSLAKLKKLEYFGNYYLLGTISRNICYHSTRSIFVFFCFSRFTNVLKLQNDEKDVTNIQYNISSVCNVISMQAAACYTSTNGSSHSSLNVSVYLFMWWLTLLGVTMSKISSRLFSIPAVKQRHMNAVFRYVMFCMIIIYTFKIPVGVNGDFSQSSKLLAYDGAESDWFGASVSIFDTTGMIGAHADDDKAGDAGMNETNYYCTILYYVIYYTSNIFSNVY
jgi:hypothetical protein